MYRDKYPTGDIGHEDINFHKRMDSPDLFSAQQNNAIRRLVVAVNVLRHLPDFDNPGFFNANDDHSGRKHIPAIQDVKGRRPGRGLCLVATNNQSVFAESREAVKGDLPQFPASQRVFPSDCLPDALKQTFCCAEVARDCPRSVRVLRGSVHGS
jgi:hypothetical protein